MTGSMKYRLRAVSPDSAHIKRYAAALRQLQAIGDNRGYAAIAGHHGAPDGYCWHWQASARSPVRAQLFLPWHRAYLLKLEQSLQDIDEDVALPWWDWTVDRRVPDPYDAADIDGEGDPLRRFRMDLDEPNLRLNRFTRRAPGANPLARLPVEQEVESALADPDWSSFSDALQQLHDSVHVWVGGDMGSVDRAAYDPIFYAHHCMVDRLWYLWQIRHGLANIPDELLDMVLDPFPLAVGDVLDTRSIGYEYAESVVDIDTGDGGASQ